MNVQLLTFLIALFLLLVYSWYKRKQRKKRYQRHLIYKAMLRELAYSDEYIGFCYVLLCFWRKKSIFPIVEVEDLPELMKHRPKHIGTDYCYWFPTTEEGKQLRIKILKQAINETKY